MRLKKTIFWVALGLWALPLRLWAQSLAADIDTMFVQDYYDGLQSNRITWRSKSEFEAGRYVLERSLDAGHSWEKVGEQPANSPNGANYTLVDRLIKGHSAIIYRLSVVEKSGYRVQLCPLLWNFKQVAIAYDSRQRLLHIASGYDKNLTVSCYDMHENLLYQTELSAAARYRLAWDLGAGFYRLQVRSAAGVQWLKLAVLY